MPLKKTRAKAQTSIEPSGSPALLRFHRTWQELEKLEARMAKKSAEMGALYTRFQTDILPVETEHCRLVYQQVERLIGFMGRKSLSDWHRELLGDWIDEDCRYLESNPFRGELDLTALTINFQSQAVKHLSPETVAEQCDYLAQEFKEKLGIDIPNEVLQELVTSPDKIEAFVQSWLKQQSDEAQTAADPTTDWEESAGTADEFSEDDADNAFDDDWFEYPPLMSAREQARLDELFGKSSLKQLYRKLALALHPDRETDESLQQQKTHLMGELSRAWEHKDMFTLLRLAHTHLPGSESLLSEENLAVINPLLKLRVSQQSIEYYSMSDSIYSFDLVLVQERQVHRRCGQLLGACVAGRASVRVDGGQQRPDLPGDSSGLPVPTAVARSSFDGRAARAVVVASPPWKKMVHRDQELFLDRCIITSAALISAAAEVVLVEFVTRHKSDSPMAIVVWAWQNQLTSHQAFGCARGRCTRLQRVVNDGVL